MTNWLLFFGYESGESLDVVIYLGAVSIYGTILSRTLPDHAVRAPDITKSGVTAGMKEAEEKRKGVSKSWLLYP